MNFARLGESGSEIPVVLDGDRHLDLRPITSDLPGTLADEGARVAVLDRDAAGADPRFAAFAVDVSDRAGVERAVAAVAKRFGRVDIVVNNAGIGAQGDIPANDDDDEGGMQ